MFGLRMLEQFTELVRGWRSEQSGPTAGWSGTSICLLEDARTQEQEERAPDILWSSSRRRKHSVLKLFNYSIINIQKLILSQKMQNSNYFISQVSTSNKNCCYCTCLLVLLIPCPLVYLFAHLMSTCLLVNSY